MALSLTLTNPHDDAKLITKILRQTSYQTCSPRYYIFALESSSLRVIVWQTCDRADAKFCLTIIFREELRNFSYIRLQRYFGQMFCGSDVLSYVCPPCHILMSALHKLQQ